MQLSFTPTHRRSFQPKRFRFIRLRPIIDISDETGRHPSRIALQKHAASMRHTQVRRTPMEARAIALQTARRLYGQAGS